SVGLLDVLFRVDSSTLSRLFGSRESIISRAVFPISTVDGTATQALESILAGLGASISEVSAAHFVTSMGPYRGLSQAPDGSGYINGARSTDEGATVVAGSPSAPVTAS